MADSNEMDTSKALPPHNEAQVLAQTSAAPPLEYAPRPRLAWVARHWKLLIFLAICIAICIPIYVHWQSLKQRALWIYWSRQAAAHKMPENSADAVISDPVRAKAAPTTNPDYIAFTGMQGFPRPSGSVALYAPEAYRQLQLVDSRLNITGGIGTPVAFMGTLHRPDGIPRLVIVTGGSGVHNQMLAMTWALVLPLPKVFDPLPPTGLPQLGRGTRGSGGPPVPTQFRTGVTDPADPTHIVFEFTAGQPRAARGAPPPSTNPITGGGIIDAYLQNDDSIAFTLRSSWGIRNPGLGRDTTLAGDESSLTAAPNARWQTTAARGQSPTTRSGATR